MLGIIRALWPEWAADEPSGGIYKFRADERLGRIADEMFEDSGETPTCALVARTVTQLRALGFGAQANVWIEVHGVRQGFGTVQEAITALQDEQAQDRIITPDA